MPDASAGATEEPSPRVLIVAGEASGDRYGAGLMEHLRARRPGIRFTGIGGSLMRQAGLSPLMQAERIAVMGFVEVLTSLPVLRRAFRLCAAEVAAHPDLVLLIDYPGFNLRLAREAARVGVPVVYFVSPQVWAWKPGRVKTIRETVRRMLVIFPFEEEFYRRHGVDALFVGHPMVEILAPDRPREPRAAAAARLGLDPGRRIVGLLPGSRFKEVRRNLPPILGAARLLASRIDRLQFMLPVASTLRTDVVRRMADLPGLVLIDSDLQAAMELCEAAVVSSGTATVEAGLMEIPMVIVYRLHPLTYSLARSMTKLSTFGMVNLVAGRRIVPELIQSDCTPERIALELERILTDRALQESIRADLRQMRARLGGPGAFRRAAEAITGVLGEAPPGGRSGGPGRPM